MKNFLEKIKCCINPWVLVVVLIGYLVITNIKTGFSINLTILLLLICPISMVAMMFFMNKDIDGHGSCKTGRSNNKNK